MSDGIILIIIKPYHLLCLPSQFTLRNSVSWHSINLSNSSHSATSIQHSTVKFFTQRSPCICQVQDVIIILGSPITMGSTSFQSMYFYYYFKFNAGRERLKLSCRKHTTSPPIPMIYCEISSLNFFTNGSLCHRRSYCRTGKL